MTLFHRHHWETMKTRYIGCKNSAWTRMPIEKYAIQQQCTGCGKEVVRKYRV